MHLLQMIVPLFYRPLADTVRGGDYLVFGVFGLFIILSRRLPTHRPLWQRRTYIWVEIGALLATRLFSRWGLDLFLLLVLAKSCFLLRLREVIVTAIASGIFWQVITAQEIAQQFSQPMNADHLHNQLEATLAQPLSIQVITVILTHATVFIAAGLLIVLLCLTVISERKSREREAALTQAVETLAADLERARITRDIHDSLGQTLTSLDVQIELAQRLYERGSDQVRPLLDTSQLLARQSLQEVRRAFSTLREEPFNLNMALTHLMAPFKSDPSLRAESKIDLPQLPLQTSHQIYCIVKEGLENIRRHSHAHAICLQGKATPTDVIIYLEDDGDGFDPSQPSSGFGLRGMQERAQLLGGSVRVNSTPGQGTCIQLRVPR